MRHDTRHTFRESCLRGNWALCGPHCGYCAFDTYRAETLKRLEEEQRSFREYLERLPQTKYRAEFEQFIQQRRAQQPQA
jgi:Protein of unknown function (DUF2852)